MTWSRTLLSTAAFAVATSAQGAPPPGTRHGPYVMSNAVLSDLLKDGFAVRGVLGNNQQHAIFLQKEARFFVCATDGEAPQYRCAELSEQAESGASSLPLPAPKMQMSPLPAPAPN